jgi:SAM-dependent methyltransferase
MRKLVLLILRTVIPFRAVESLNRFLRFLTAQGYRFQFFYEWRVMARPPEWFDQHIDLYWKWHLTRNPSSWERGIFGLLAMRQGCRVLDLCCGTGFFAYYFYSGRAGSIISMDYSAAAIDQAKRNYNASNLEFRRGDIRTDLPEGDFDNVVLNAALEYFTPAEAGALLAAIKSRLGPGGILSGNSVITPAGTLAHLDQKQTFHSREELANFLQSHFSNVTVLTTTFIDPGLSRTNLYFFASESPVPLSAAWPDLLEISAPLRPAA